MESDNSNNNVNLSPSSSLPVTNHHLPSEEKTRENGMLTSGNMELLEKLQTVTEEFKVHQGYIADRHFRDYTRLDGLKALVQTACDVCGECERYVLEIGNRLSQLREHSDSIRELIQRKLREEELDSWRLGPQPNATDPDAVAEDKEYLSRAATSRASIGQASVDLAASVEFVAKLEADALNAASEAREAADKAQEARLRAEEACVAAEEKHKAEEETRRRSEERASQKAEELQRQKEEEKRRLAETERTSAATPGDDNSPRRHLDERGHREGEKRDPKQWNPFIYRKPSGEFDHGYCCVVRAFPGDLRENDLDCSPMDQLDGILHLEENEELVSNIVRIAPSTDNLEIKYTEPIAIAIPHCAPRNVFTREPVIKILQNNGHWTELETKEVTFDDIKDPKFVEVRTKRLGTFAVVTRLKRENIVVTKKGGKFASAVDQRIVLTFKHGTFKANTSFALEVQPVELAAVSDVKYRHPVECESLLASSPIVQLALGRKKLLKPMTLSTPIPPPPNPGKIKRPGTAVEKIDHKPSPSRPTSAFVLSTIKKEEDDGDDLHLLSRVNSGFWTVDTSVSISQSKNKDIATFELSQPVDRVMLVRTKANIRPEKIEKICKIIETSLKQRVVQLILRQHLDDPSDTILTCVNHNKLERTIRRLADEGYDEGPMISKDIILKEGQFLEVHFRGNLMTDVETPIRIVFNSQLKTRASFMITEIDKFAQKSFECYRGFAQVYTRGLVPRTAKEEEKNKAGKQQQDWAEGDILLCEMLMNLPKPEAEPPKPLVRIPVTFKAEGALGVPGVVDDDLLRNLAVDLGDEWRPLARSLNIKAGRIQAILRNNVNNEVEQSIYDMLLTWVKKIPRSMDKVQILCRALMEVGRVDLVEEIRDRDDEYRRQKAEMVKESNLKRAFVKVAQNSHVVNDWKFFARQLGVSEGDLQEIEETCGSMRDRCYSSLVRWKEKTGGAANQKILIKKLRQCKFRHVAEQVEYICS